MAELNTTQNKPQGKKVRVKKMSTRIDMTPMVDLAFLLLTFFILTGSLYKFKVLDIQSPEQVDNVTQLQPVNDKDVLNLVLGEDNKIYWWIGLEPPVLETTYSSNGVRKILLDKHHENKNLYVLIKPSDDSRYENLVDLLDEISITNTTRYAILDVSEEDKLLLQGKAGY